jgi:hypothetical protein
MCFPILYKNPRVSIRLQATITDLLQRSDSENAGDSAGFLFDKKLLSVEALTNLRRRLGVVDIVSKKEKSL